MSDDKQAYADWIAALSEMENAQLNKTNPHFRSKYSDFSSVRKATLPALKKHGLGIAQKTAIVDGAFVFISRIIHKSGVVLDEAHFPLNNNQKIQQVGSEITYAKRYTWSALCGISSDEDDDGNAANDAPPRTQQTTKQQAPSPERNPQRGQMDDVKFAIDSFTAKNDMAGLDAYMEDAGIKAWVESFKADNANGYVRLQTYLKQQREKIMATDDCPIPVQAAE